MNAFHASKLEMKMKPSSHDVNRFNDSNSQNCLSLIYFFSSTLEITDELALVESLETQMNQLKIMVENMSRDWQCMLKSYEKWPICNQQKNGEFLIYLFFFVGIVNYWWIISDKSLLIFTKLSIS